MLSVSELISALSKEQCRKDDVFLGNYPSTRYHSLFGFKREEDNVYFVAWINQLLKRHTKDFSGTELKEVNEITELADKAIHRYRNRYGEETYNFYRPKDWFPNGKLLGRFVLFQPTDDSDDTSIAMRGRAHSKDYARTIKEVYQHQSNGLRGRWIKRIPKKYRKLRFYNTWIGSEGLYVDTDLVVLCNILMFNCKC